MAIRYKKDVLSTVANDQVKTLFDGQKEVKNITVFAMFRNNADYLDFFTQNCDAIERMYPQTTFTYYFLENDSSDNTRAKLVDWFKNGNKRGRVLLGQLDQDYQNRGENFERTITLAHLRNTLADTAFTNGNGLESDWTLFIDSNIYFQPDTLSRMFEESSPKVNHVGMIAGYGKQVHTTQTLKRMGIEVKLPSEINETDVIIDFEHYYDTFTFIDGNGLNHYPYCAFKRCQICQKTRPANYPLPLIEPTQNVFEVKGCFGGVALIDSEVLRHPRVRWGTLSFDATNSKSLSDHVLFCDRMLATTGKKVVIVQSIDNIYRTY
jgi:hypothetical protein